jgi:hypothetical protein
MQGNQSSYSSSGKRKQLIRPKYFGRTDNGTTASVSQPGDLLVAVAANRTSGTFPTLTGWTLVENNVHPTGSQSVSIYQKIAVIANESCTWTGSFGLRSIWSFPNGEFDNYNFSHSSGSGTAFAWEAQPVMSANTIVCAYVTTTSNQTSFLTPLANTISPTGPLFTRNDAGSAGAWAGDSDFDKLSSFAPSGGTFDTTTTKYTALAFTIKQAAP